MPITHFLVWGHNEQCFWNEDVLKQQGSVNTQIKLWLFGLFCLNSISDQRSKDWENKPFNKNVPFTRMSTIKKKNPTKTKMLSLKFSWYFTASNMIFASQSLHYKHLLKTGFQVYVYFFVHEIFYSSNICRMTFHI